MYNSLLQTLFLSKSVPALTSLPVTSPTLSVKKSMKMYYSTDDKIYYILSQEDEEITNMYIT